MKKQDVKKLEQRLQEERDRALKALRKAEEEEATPQGEAAGDISRFPTHMADEGSDTQEQEQDFLTVHRASERITRIDEALEILYDDPDRYVTCERCGNEITFERLDFVPWTRLCSRCAAQVEAGGGGAS